MTDLTKIDVPNERNGWTLTTVEPPRLIWTSPSEYGIKVELPQASVTGLLPPLQINTDNGQPSLREHKTLHPGTGDAQEAIDIAVSWLENHPIEVDNAVRDLPGIGDRTADYLALRHGATTFSDVEQEYRHGQLKEIVQERFYDDLEAQFTQIPTEK